MKRYVFGLMAAWMLAGTAPVMSASPPPLPEEFTRSGTLDFLAKDYMVINDQRYLLSSQLKVHTLKRAAAPLSDLKVGDAVGVIVTGEGGGKLGTVEELWVLPNIRPLR